MSTPEIKHELYIQFGNEYGPEEEQAILEVLRKNAPTSGSACVKFEKEFAEYCGTKYARCVSNGTAALFLSMIGIGLKPGDRVITTPMTWIATAAAAATLGAEIDFVDVDPETFNLDPARIEEKITPKTKAIVPVHLYGQCCDMDAILGIADRHGIAVVEDACHTAGGAYKGRKAGSRRHWLFRFHEQTHGHPGRRRYDYHQQRKSSNGSPCTAPTAPAYTAPAPSIVPSTNRKFPQGKRFWWQDLMTGYNSA